MYEWLENLKVGDKVIVDNWGQSIGTVERVTATLVIVGSCRYRKRDGYQLGGSSYSRGLIREPTPERLAAVRHAVLAKRFSKTEWHKYSLEDLEKVAALLAAFPVTP